MRAPGRTRSRTRLEIGGGALVLTPPDGRASEFALAGADLAVADATFARRFVRHLRVWTSAGDIHLITPPEEGSIAPRAAQLPRAPEDAGIIDRHAFDTVSEWLAGGARLGGRTIEELARLARLATSAFAAVIGERAAQIAIETIWPFGGPMRGGATGDDVRHRLRPLELAARDSDRAAEALVAALAAATR
ncbi:MAG TPA: hypothetical protein VK698_31575 [Kofleriaceae bacterium]|nr:hypothetical protein [Kofleriaceae bacterium]